MSDVYELTEKEFWGLGRLLNATLALLAGRISIEALSQKTGISAERINAIKFNGRISSEAEFKSLFEAMELDFSSAVRFQLQMQSHVEEVGTEGILREVGEFLGIDDENEEGEMV